MYLGKGIGVFSTPVTELRVIMPQCACASKVYGSANLWQLTTSGASAICFFDFNLRTKFEQWSL